MIFKVLGSGCRVQGNLSEVLLDRTRRAAPVCDQEHLLAGFGFGLCLGIRVWGLGSWVEGSGGRVQG